MRCAARPTGRQGGAPAAQFSQLYRYDLDVEARQGCGEESHLQSPPQFATQMTAGAARRPPAIEVLRCLVAECAPYLVSRAATPYITMSVSARARTSRSVFVPRIDSSTANQNAIPNAACTAVSVS